MNLNQVTLPSTNIARGRDFYLKLGFTLIVDSAHYVRLQAPEGGTTLSLHLDERPPKGEGAIMYLECADLGAAYERLVRAGVTFAHAPKDQSWLWREAHFADPDGNRLCLYNAGKNRIDPPWRVALRSATSVVEFWYEFASTYSYPAAMRIESEANRRGVAVIWRPFLLGPIFKARGLSDSPFNVFEAKGRYMWRDLERITSQLGMPFARPKIFPQNGLAAARVAIALEPTGKAPAFSCAVYAANFAEGRDISDQTVLASLLGTVGAPVEMTLAAAASSETKQHLRVQTDAALAHGLFGAPSFRVGNEIFWGNDRLEAALDWALTSPAEPVVAT
jgi:2-hydroxychromene-2-carboxylate isomerase/predicted enzyme related to lactoylglutathione lyase